MNSKYIKVSSVTFFITFIFLIVTLSTINYRLLISDFKDLELEQNSKNIETLIKKIQKEFEFLNSVVIDNSRWDETYEFIQNENKDYIDANYREGSNTLRDLGFNFLIFLNLDKKVVFSDYLEIEKDSFEKEFLKTVDEIKENSFYGYENRYLYVSKEPILKSDGSGDVKGYLIGGKYFFKSGFSNFSNIFKKIEISNKMPSIYNKNFKIIDGLEAKVKIVQDSDTISNLVTFYNKDRAIFTLFTSNPEDIMKKGERTIFILNFILSSFVFITMILLYRNQKMIQRYNFDLEKEVDLKTKELVKTLDELTIKNHELDRLARIDPLTNIRNRRSFFIDGESLLKESIEDNNELSLLLIDLDYFKKINDTFGHAGGDEVLKEFCNVVNSLIEDEDIFGRLGGEEFSIILKNKNLEEAEKIAEKIRINIENTIVKFNDKDIKFTISTGLVHRKDEVELDKLLDLADAFLYEAKKVGRNKVIREKVR